MLPDDVVLADAADVFVADEPEVKTLLIRLVVISDIEDMESASFIQAEYKYLHYDYAKILSYRGREFKIYYPDEIVDVKFYDLDIRDGF